MGKLDFGIKDLNRLFVDVEMNGGIISIVGTPDSGYEIFAKTVLLSGEEYNKIALIGKETCEEFVRALKIYKIGDPKDVKVLEVGSYVFRKIAVSIERLSKLLSTGDLLTLLEHSKEMEESMDIMTFLISKIHEFSRSKILIDFIDILGDDYPLAEIFKMITAMLVLSKIKDNFFIIAIEKDLNPELERKIISLSDIAFLLYSERKSVDEKLRIMEIMKVKNYPHLQFYATYTFLKNEGLRIEHIQRI